MVSNPFPNNQLPLFCNNSNTPIRLPRIATSTIKKTTIRPASSCLANTRICLGRIVEKITPLIMIIQTLKQSHPIITRVMLSIRIGNKQTLMIVAMAKLMISL